MPPSAREEKLREVLEDAAVRHVWPAVRALAPGLGLLPEPELFGFAVGGDAASGPLAEVYFGPPDLPQSLVVSRASSLIGLPGKEILPIPCGGLVPFAVPPGSPGGHPNVVARSPGTLGGWVNDGTDGAVVLLSCNHVLADCNAANAGDPTLVGMQLPGDRCGALKRFVPLALAPAVNTVDAAVSTPEGGSGSPSTAGAVPPARGMRVTKNGRRTGRTQGTVEAIGAAVQFSYPMGLDGAWVGVNFRGVFKVVGDGAPFALPGDSGAFVAEGETDRLVGLLFGGERNGAYAFACTVADLTAMLHISP